MIRKTASPNKISDSLCASAESFGQVFKVLFSPFLKIWQVCLICFASSHNSCNGHPFTNLELEVDLDQESEES